MMGRHSGFIACYAALAKSDANYVLIPEVSFQLDGPHGLLTSLQERLKRRGHAVIVTAEGAGQSLLAECPKTTDASGNARLGDIGLFLKDRINAHFESQGIELNLKHIDPSHLIRSVPANPFDSVYSLRLTHNPVDAAMCGRTEMIVGRWHGRFVHVPIPLAIHERNQVDPNGDLWMSVLESTGSHCRLSPAVRRKMFPGFLAHDHGCLKTSPSFITKTTFRMALMSSSGLP